MILQDRGVRNFYFNLSSEQQIEFDERAGYLEYEELLSRKVAEYKTFIEIMKLRRAKCLPS